jgi:hypothetical protein
VALDDLSRRRPEQHDALSRAEQLSRYQDGRQRQLLQIASSDQTADDRERRRRRLPRRRLKLRISHDARRLR